MTRNRATSLIIGLAVLMASAATPISAQEVTRSITLNRDAKIGGQLLPRGDYTIKFVDGKDGQLMVLRKGREVAKAGYKVAKLNRPAADTVLILNAAADGSYQIGKIEFKGLISTLILE